MIFSGDVYFRWCNALYNSGYMFFGGFGRIYTFSTWRRTRFLKRCFSIRLEWRSVPSRCFGCSLLSAVHSWKPETPFYELHVAVMRDQGQDFLGHLCQSQVPVVPESPGVLLPGDSAQGLPIRSFSCVDLGIAGSSICVNNNNNQQQPTTTNNNEQRTTHTTNNTHPHQTQQQQT